MTFEEKVALLKHSVFMTKEEKYRPTVKEKIRQGDKFDRQSVGGFDITSDDTMPISR